MAGEAKALPTGTVTFLFTDVERSTRAVAELGDERYADLQEQHRVILRREFESHGGVEVGTEGDAFFVAFTTASDAVTAAVEGQRRMREESPLRVRIGIHTGEAVIRTGDYVGHDVHVAKRVQDVGHGGQILLSQTTADLVRSRFELKELGAYRLKDVDDATVIFQVIADGLTREFPVPRAAPAIRHNLPVQRTSFVGREDEIERVVDLLTKSRAVTITGVGGNGKTRLAVEVGVRMLARYRDGVFFCDLAPLSDPNMLPGLITSTMELQARPSAGSAGPSTPEGVLDALASFEALLILDNCEHLIDGCADLVDQILERCPQVTVMATSREALDIDGEHAFALRSLAVPTDGSAVADSVELFVERASAVKNDFELTDENSSAVADICRRLDGMPLAIELAAAQVAHISPEEISARLDDRFELLSGGRRRVQRQQTLAATVDWSYDLLSDAEREVLSGVAVFPGAFTLEAADALFSDRTRSVLPVLKSLVAKSLITIESGAPTRYRLLETIRFYAQEKLVATGQADTMRSRHRDWLLAWLREHPDRQFDEADLTLVRTVGHDVPAALAWCEREGRFDLLAELLSLAHMWTMGLQDAFPWFELALAHADEISPEAHVSLSSRRAWLGLGAVEPIPQTARYARQAIDLANGEPLRGVSDAYGILSLARSFEGIVSRIDVADEVRALGERGLEHASDPHDEVSVIFCYGLALMNIDDLDRAIEVLERGYALATWRPPPTITANLSLAYHARGNDQRARFFAEVARDVVVGAGYPGWTLVFSLPLAICLAVDDRHEDALARIETDLAVPGATAIPAALTATVTVLGVLAFLRGDFERASTLLWSARAAFDRAEVRGPSDLMLYSHYVRQLRGMFDHETSRRLRERGLSMSLEDAVSHGMT